MKKNFYITTTLPYVNSDPHVGFAMEIIRADIIARHKRLMGYDVFFNTGTDEHGIKIYERATAAREDIQAYADRYAERFKGLKEALNLSYTNFIRTTDPHHIAAAQEFWKVCEKNGDIYKKNYKMKYCVGCELEKTDSELVDGKCSIHPNLEIELIEEENYFFRFSKYQQPLLDLYEKNPEFVLPDFRFNEIKRFVERGLEDFSISRLKAKLPWGIEVPGDPDHVMYVWFDALVDYISAIGWPEDQKTFEKWWPVTQYAGKDNLRQQSAMWQAMLMSAKLDPSKQIIINGFINSGGQKMSKSLGNVIDPFPVVDEYGTEALRYYVARELSVFEDSDMTMEKFKEAYNANLANGLGNLVSRIMKMAETNLDALVEIPEENDLWHEGYVEALENFNIKKAIDIIFEKIQQLDQDIQSSEPFKLVKSDPEKGKAKITELVICLNGVAQHLEPFLPETAGIIQKLVAENKSPSTPLFVRKD